MLVGSTDLSVAHAGAARKPDRLKLAPDEKKMVAQLLSNFLCDSTCTAELTMLRL